MATNKSKTRNFKTAKKVRSLKRMSENNAEFAQASKAGTLIRNAFGPMVKATSPNRLITGRMQKILLKVVQSDPTSFRGQRHISKGDLSMLTNFDFNNRAPLSGTFYPYLITSIDRAGGKFTVAIPPFIPDSSVSAPLSSTHFRLWLAAAEIDLEKAIFSPSQVKTGYLPLDMLECKLPDLEVKFTPESKQALMLSLSVEFFQEVNGIMYQLRMDELSAVKVLHAERAII